MKFAIIKTGGKQYLVKEGQELYVDRLHVAQDADIEFESLAQGDLEAKKITIGKPLLDAKVKGKIVENLKGDKIRVARFKAKSRYRKVLGFRALLSKIKIVNI